MLLSLSLDQDSDFIFGKLDLEVYLFLTTISRLSCPPLPHYVPQSSCTERAGS